MTKEPQSHIWILKYRTWKKLYYYHKLYYYYKFLIKSSHLNKSPYFEQSLLYLSSLSEVTWQKKKRRACDRGCSSWHLSPVTSGYFSARVLCMQLHYFEEKRDWSQRNKRPSTSSKFDVVTCSSVGIMSIPSLGLFRYIWTVVYAWTSSEKPTVIFLLYICRCPCHSAWFW